MVTEGLVSSTDASTTPSFVSRFDDALLSFSGFLMRPAIRSLFKYLALGVALVCLYLVSSILYLIISGKIDFGCVSTGLFWLVLLAASLFGGVHFFLVFIRNFRSTSEDANAATICLVEVFINNETVLTVRSWWPVRMANPDVERHGVRVAMSSARRWLVDNAQGRVKKVRFNDCAARKICNEYLCDVSLSGKPQCHGDCSQCSVCLEDIESGVSCVSMKKCGHVFHQECLSTWIAQSSRLACVICRADHSDLLPPSLIKEHTVKEEPTISVLTVAIEQGTLVSETQ